MSGFVKECEIWEKVHGNEWVNRQMKDGEEYQYASVCVACTLRVGKQIKNDRVSERVKPSFFCIQWRLWCADVSKGFPIISDLGNQSRNISVTIIFIHFFIRWNRKCKFSWRISEQLFQLLKTFTTTSIFVVQTNRVENRAPIVKNFFHSKICRKRFCWN